MKNRALVMSTKTKQHQRSNDGEQHIFQHYKDNVEELLHTWTTYSKSVTSNNLFLIGVAAQICLKLSKRNSFEALEIFLERLPDIPEYSKSQDVLRAKISLALHKKQADVVQDIIKVGITMIKFIFFLPGITCTLLKSVGNTCVLADGVFVIYILFNIIQIRRSEYHQILCCFLSKITCTTANAYWDFCTCRCWPNNFYTILIL